MAKKTWTFRLDDRLHVVELEHGYFSGKRIIHVDGKLLETTTKGVRAFIDFGSEHSFQIGRHPVVVHIRTNGLTFSYDLSIAGRSVTTGKEVSSAPVPAWIWVFVSACLLIPIVSLGGALPGAIGAGGAAGCYAIAKDAKKQIRTRIVLCLVVTILCWVLFIVTLLMIKRATS